MIGLITLGPLIQILFSKTLILETALFNIFHSVLITFGFEFCIDKSSVAILAAPQTGPDSILYAITE